MVLGGRHFSCTLDDDPGARPQLHVHVASNYETTRQIRADPNLKTTPIIAVSSYAMKGDEEKARASGCNHYVTKPYSPIQLLRIIQVFLGAKSRS